MAISGDVFKLNGYADQMALANVALSRKTHLWISSTGASASTYDRLSFFNEVIQRRSSMPVSIYGPAAGGNITDGWIKQGYAGGGTTYCFRLNYSNDVSGSSVKASGLNSTYYLSGNSTQVELYSSGGNSYISNTERLVFTMDTTSPVAKGFMTFARSTLCAGGNNSDSYYMGGQTAGTYYSSVDRLNHATDTTNMAAKGVLMSNASTYSNFAFRTNIYTWAVCGTNTTTPTYTSYVQRVQHTADMVTAINRANWIWSGGLAGVGSTATDGTGTGNAQGGGALQSNIGRMNFVTETPTVRTVTLLDAANNSYGSM